MYDESSVVANFVANKGRSQGFLPRKANRDLSIFSIAASERREVKMQLR